MFFTYNYHHFCTWIITDIITWIHKHTVLFFYPTIRYITRPNHKVLVKFPFFFLWIILLCFQSGTKTDSQHTILQKRVKIPQAKQLTETFITALWHIESIPTKTKQTSHIPPSPHHYLSATTMFFFSLYLSIWVSVCWPQHETEWSAA